MGWVHLSGYWLNMGLVVYAKKLDKEGSHITAVQIGITAPDPAGRHAENESTGLVSWVIFGKDADKILRQFRL